MLKSRIPQVPAIVGGFDTLAVQNGSRGLAALAVGLRHQHGNVRYFPALAFAHLAFCAAMIRALPAALILRLTGRPNFGTSIFGDPTLDPFCRCLAHLAFCAAAMAALPAADIPPFFGPRLPGVLTASTAAAAMAGTAADDGARPEAPNNSDSSAFSLSISVARPAALVS